MPRALSKTFKINSKHRRFVKYFVQLGSASEAGRLVEFDPSYARQLSNHPAILNMIKKAEDAQGLTDEFLLAHHKKLFQEPEWQARHSALTLAYKLNKKIDSDAVPTTQRTSVMVIIKNENGSKPSQILSDATSDISVQRADHHLWRHRIKLRHPRC